MAYSVIEPDHLHQPSASNAGTSALNMAGGTAAGIGAGAAYGAYAGLGCGPMLIICSPAGAIAGAMGGGIFGLGVGTYQAARLMLPADKASAMNALIENTFAEFRFSSALDAEFRSRAASRWQYDEAAAGNIDTLDGAFYGFIERHLVGRTGRAIDAPFDGHDVTDAEVGLAAGCIIYDESCRVGVVSDTVHDDAAEIRYRADGNARPRNATDRRGRRWRAGCRLRRVC